MASRKVRAVGGLVEGEEGFSKADTEVKSQILFHTLSVGHVVVLFSRKLLQLCYCISKCFVVFSLENLIFVCVNEWALTSSFVIPINCHLSHYFI